MVVSSDQVGRLSLTRVRAQRATKQRSACSGLALPHEPLPGNRTTEAMTALRRAPYIGAYMTFSLH
jgi:hypothetical protein